MESLSKTLLSKIYVDVHVACGRVELHNKYDSDSFKILIL